MKNITEAPEARSSAEFFSIDGIFSVESFSCSKSFPALTNLQVCNNFVVAATGRNTLLRFPVGATHDVVEIEITRLADDRVHNLFLDPMGWHTIICMQSGMSFYTNRLMKRVRVIQKAKDILIDSVAWNQFNTSELSTQEILVGSNDGIIYETVLLSEEGRFIASSIEQYWRQVITIGNSVTSLEVIRFPTGSTLAIVGEPQRCVVLATTPSRMYQFAGWIHSHSGGSSVGGIPASSSVALLSQVAGTVTGATTARLPSSSASLSTTDGGGVADAPSNQSTAGSQAAGLVSTAIPSFFHGVFTGDANLPAGSKVTEFPQNFGYSDLKLYRPRDCELPCHFAWMTGPGVYFGYLKTEQLSLAPRTLAPKNMNATQPEDFFDTTGDSDDAGRQLTDVFAGRGVNLTRKTKLLGYPVIPMLERPGPPLGITLTAFHVVIAYADRVKVINVLDDRTVFSMPINVELGQAPALGICRDPVSGLIWLFGSLGIARLRVNNEACRIWQIYANRLQFDEARRFCQDESQLDTVNMREAEYCFDRGDFMRSAKLFAHTSAPFEEVALRFSQLSLEHQPINRQTNSSPILMGLMVTSDDDVINSIVSDSADNSPGIDRKREILPKNPAQEPGDAGTPLQTVNAEELAPVYQRVYGNLEQMVDSAAPLKVLVATKLDILEKLHKSKSKTDTSIGQIGLLSLWLVELLLTEIGFMRDQVTTNRKLSVVDTGRLKAAEYEFKQLLVKPDVRAMLPHTKHLLFNLIESHGANEEFFFLAELVKDHSRLCDKYMHLGRHMDALNLLNRECFLDDNCVNCMYTHATRLAVTHPEELVKSWLRFGKQLDPVRLLPAILLLPPNHAMHYLNVAVFRLACSDQAVHHLLISLCADASKTKSRGSESDCPLMTYLEQASAGAVNLVSLGDRSRWTYSDSINHAEGDDLQSSAAPRDQPGFDNIIQATLPYDPGFALRTCKEVNHLRGTVFILKLLGLHQQALQTAIDADNIQLSKEIAQNDSLSTETCRHLWMRLAKHMIGKRNSIQEATTLLRECSLLKLEDILPYFHDFVTVDQFKDSICSSLDSYCDRIEEVKRDMQNTMESAQGLRTGLGELCYRYDVLESDSRCCHCGHILVQRSFYVFPCGHRFHASCLIELVRPRLTTSQRSKLQDLLRSQQQFTSSSVSSEDPETDLDQLIASDCARCGRMAIDSVGELHFPNQEAYESELAIWK